MNAPTFPRPGEGVGTVGAAPAPSRPGAAGQVPAAAMRELDVRYRSVGARAVLRLHAPGSPPLQVDGVVSWARLTALGPGLPAGAGIASSILIAPSAV